MADVGAFSSTVRQVDRLLVFNKGSIVEQGDHASLLQNTDGHYVALYQLQQDAEVVVL